MVYSGSSQNPNGGPIYRVGRFEDDPVTEHEDMIMVMNVAIDFVRLKMELAANLSMKNASLIRWRKPDLPKHSNISEFLRVCASFWEILRGGVKKLLLLIWNRPFINEYCKISVTVCHKKCLKILLNAKH